MDPQRSGEVPSWQEIAAQLAHVDAPIAWPHDSIAPGATGQISGSAIQTGAHSWLRIFDGDGGDMAGPAGGNLHGGP